MNRNKLKTYAPKARRDFIAAVSARAIKFGVSRDNIEPVHVQGNVALISGQAHPKKVAEQRAKLESRIKTRGFEQVMEEAAYTWFNRFAAIRYMEVHGYLDHGYRVLSHPEGKPIPEIVEHAQHLDLPGLNMEKVIELKLDGTKEGELYRMLLLAQCNALHAAMPFLFERINDETELLLPDNLLHSDSVIRQLVNEIDEADWQEIEIIGWLYQFYISEKKDQVIGKVVKSEDIPAATQLFTPNWIVKYMVQNTLGAKWLATYPQSGIRAKMEYFIEPAEQTDEVKAQLTEITPKELNPEEITFLDPACGSGHILVEAYDLFKEIYLERGYVLRDVPRLILEKNLFGLDIDDRAAQMAAFALLMKAREDDRRVFSSSLHLNLVAIQDSQRLDVENICRVLELEPTHHSLLNGAFDRPIHNFMKLFNDAKNFGSLALLPTNIKANITDLRNLVQATSVVDGVFEHSLQQSAGQELEPFVAQCEILARQYDCIAANPPYMGRRYMNDSVKSFLDKNYPDAGADLFASFIDRCLNFLRSGGHISMVTVESWMFLGSYESLRNRVSSRGIRNLLNIPYDGKKPTPMDLNFGISVFSVCDVYDPSFNGRYSMQRHYDLTDEGKPLNKFNDIHKFIANFSMFKKIPGSPISFWASKGVVASFNSSYLKDIAFPKEGMTTGDTARFLRLWQEVGINTIKFDAKNSHDARTSGLKWFPYNKGGKRRKWYGNNEYVFNWLNDGAELKAYEGSFVRNETDFFKPCITWGKITSVDFSARQSRAGFGFDTGGLAAFPAPDDMDGILGFLCSNTASYIARLLNPTLNTTVGNIASLPYSKDILGDKYFRVNEIATECVAIATTDWDSRETSWDFVRPPILANHFKTDTIAASFVTLSEYCSDAVDRMMALEEENNALFIHAYGLCGELSPIVSRDFITIEDLDAERCIKWMVSYFVGCAMGRYSLDEPGLVYANGGNVGFDPTRYPTFPADDDGIVPIMQTDWFDDDAAARFIEFLKVAWSPETLTENLKFVADALGPKGNETPIDTIRRYLSTDFFKDHLKTYKKRPIYWLFSSGKEKAFEALVYLHRYNEGTLSRMRMEYVTPLQGRISSRIDQLGRDIDAAASTAAQNKLRKEQEKLKKQQAELIKFDEELRHRADMRINLDLDDGVKVNYGKFGNLLAEVKAITGGSDD